MEAVTGLSFTPEEVLKVGERVNNLAKAFNVREGFTRADDTLPERLMTEPLKAGASKGQVISREDLDKMLDEYYSLRGWDVKTGNAHPGKTDRSRTRIRCGCAEVIGFHAMKITLHTILGLKQVVGQRLTEIDLPQGSTVEDFLTYLRERWGDKLSTRLFDPDSGAVLPYVRIMVNGQTIHFLEGMETPLKEGDEVLILPPVSGG